MRYIFLWLLTGIIVVSSDCNRCVNNTISSEPIPMVYVPRQIEATEENNIDSSFYEVEEPTYTIDTVIDDALNDYAELLEEQSPYSFQQAGGRAELKRRYITGEVDIGVIEDILFSRSLP